MTGPYNNIRVVMATPSTPEQAGRRTDERLQHSQPQRGAYRTGGTGYLQSVSSPLDPKRGTIRSETYRRCNLTIFKFSTLVCVTGLTWACVIVYLLGPAFSQSISTSRESEVITNSMFNSAATTPRHSRAHPDENPTIEEGFRLSHSSANGDEKVATEDGLLPSTGWDVRDFIAREAFPEQFVDWDDPRTGVPVVVNKVDMRPLTPDNEALPTADLLLTILSGDTKASRERRDMLREIYDRYDGWITVGGTKTKGSNTDSTEMSFRVIFVVSDPKAPEEGKLVGDILYVRAPDGSENLVLKVKQMMSLVRHVKFKYLLKSDDDTLVCMKRLATFLHEQPEETRDKIYAGVPTACNLPTNPNRYIGRVIQKGQERWYDHKFVRHTLAGLACFPVYMQGAFYVLAQPLVEHLHRGREHFETFGNEDITIGSWLLGVDRALVEMHTIPSAHLWECVCAGDAAEGAQTRRSQLFFHNCKFGSELQECSNNLHLSGNEC